jgi:hypothetical protein
MGKLYNASLPSPKLPKAGKASKYAGKVLVANPLLNGSNPRLEGSHGWRLFNVLLGAGSAGLTYEALRAEASRLIESGELVGFANHLDWDLKRNFTLVKSDYPELMNPPTE